MLRTLGRCRPRRHELSNPGAALARPSPPRELRQKVALVLQGGGALGSYQAGVYEALASPNIRRVGAGFIGRSTRR